MTICVVLIDGKIIQYIVPIVALFQGRVLDKPEVGMTQTKYSTGGDVGHEVSTSFLCVDSVFIFGRFS